MVVFSSRGTSISKPVAFLGLAIIVAMGPGHPAYAADPDRIVIRNVRLFDSDGSTESQIVTILIENGELSLVTTDEIPEDGSDLPGGGTESRNTSDC